MHIHVPDGVFPIWLWMSCLVLLIPLLVLAIVLVRKDQKKMVITSAVTALMLIVFSIEFFGYHLNFTVLSGIMLGPWWSLISITVVNVFLSLFGHGGITVSPINILINWVEALVGYLFFRIVIKHVKGISIKSILTGVSVIAALSFSFCIFLGLIYLTGINPGFALENGNSATAVQEYVPLREFAVISVIPAMIGALIEAVFTIFIIRFIYKTKPKLLE
jgi:ABC-type Co2+ transport system permease subunit